MDNITQIDSIISQLINLRTNLLPKTFYSGARTDTASAPLPPLPTPSSSFVDPSFGSRMKRVTDPSMGNVNWMVASNAHLSGWRSDSNQFYVMSEHGEVKVFDFDQTNVITKPADFSPYSQIEPTYGTQNNYLYTIAGTNIRTIKEVHPDGTKNPIVDLDTIVPGLQDTYVGGMVEANNNIVIFFGGAGQDQHYYVLYHNLITKGYLILNTLTRINCKLHSIAIDKSGQYVMLYPTNAKPFQVMVWDTINDTITPVTTSPYGHDALGFGDWVNMDVASGPWDAGQWCYRRLKDQLDSPINLIPNVLLPKVVYMADHSNWNHAIKGENVPIISSTYSFNTDLNSSRAWSNEVIGVAVDGSGRVDRFCHHRSLVADDIDATKLNFWYEPIVNVSPNGRWAIFTSNWGKSLGNSVTNPSYFRVDVFMVELL